MAVYDVRLRINVPGLGERLQDFLAITAPTMQDAVKQAMTQVIVEPISVVKTG